MRKFNQNSLVDFLVDLIPSFKSMQKHVVEHDVADKLFSIWKNPKNKISNTMYKKPSNVSSNDIEKLVTSGMVKQIGDNIQITSKGSSVIKIMILGDENSIYDKKDDVTYVVASAFVKTPSKLKKRSQKCADSWWKNLFADE